MTTERLKITKPVVTYTWFGGEYVTISKTETGESVDVLNVAHLAKDRSASYYEIDVEAVRSEIEEDYYQNDEQYAGWWT